MIKLDDCRNNGKRKNLRGNYLMNYLEFDLYLDIVLIVYMFCAKILFKGWCKKIVKKMRWPRKHKKKVTK